MWTYALLQLHPAGQKKHRDAVGNQQIHPAQDKVKMSDLEKPSGDQDSKETKRSSKGNQGFKALLTLPHLTSLLRSTKGPKAPVRSTNPDIENKLACKFNKQKKATEYIHAKQYDESTTRVPKSHNPTNLYRFNLASSTERRTSRKPP